MVSAAVLVKLKPEFALNTPFVSFVDTLIRDTANPSVQERYFSGNLWPFSYFFMGDRSKTHPTYVRIFNRCDVLEYFSSLDGCDTFVDAVQGD